MAGEAALPVWSLAPDWSSDITERLTWRTDVLQSQNASEQLRGTRLTPRVMFEFAFGAEGDERRFMQSLAFGNGGGRWQLPVWTDGAQLAATLPSASTSVPVDTTSRSFVAPGYAVVIGADARESELLAVSAVGGAALTVAPTTRSWPAGATVYPAVVARMDAAHTQNAFTGDAGFGIARFELLQANPFTATAPVTTYRGFPVLTTRPVTFRDPELAFDRDFEVQDNDTGVPVYVDTTGLALPRQTQEFAMDGRAEIFAFRSLLYWLDGRRGVLWVPTWHSDLRVVGVNGVGVTQLVVTACGYTLHVAMELNRRDLRIETWTGDVYYRRITACAAPGDGTELLSLDTALGAPLTAADIMQVSYLQLARGDSDQVELSWWTGCFAQAALTFKATRHDA